MAHGNLPELVSIIIFVKSLLSTNKKLTKLKLITIKKADQIDQPFIQTN